MTDPTRQHLEDLIDRYVRSELTAAEARELAQKSLDDSELFEELTFSAVSKATLADRSLRERLETAPGAKVVRFPLKARIFVAGAAAAAAILLVLLYSSRLSLLRQNQPTTAENQSRATAPHPPLVAALASSAKPGQPVLLASDLQPLPIHEGAPVFRSLEPDSRSPRPAGSIISIEDGLATVDLGSLDGLAKGSELRVFRNERSAQPSVRLRVTAVFRERARGRILPGQEIQVNNRVQVAGATYLGALLQQVDALSGRGDSDAARTLAEKSVRWAETANVQPAERRKALQRLAALEYQAGSLQAAEKLYQSALDSFRASPPGSFHDESVTLNNLAVLRLLRGDYGGAEAHLSQAVAQSPTTNSVYGQSKNNLGVLAELRGDRQKAEGLYTDAVRAFAAIPDASEQERRVVETNLARVRSAR